MVFPNPDRAIRYTREGDIRVATDVGLAQFDETRLVIFNHENTSAPPTNIFPLWFEGAPGRHGIDPMAA